MTAKVINLWVKRREREIVADITRLVLTCPYCESKAFYWYDLGGLHCYLCEKPVKIPK